MRSTAMFLMALAAVLIGIAAYEHIVLAGKLPFEPSTITDIIAQAVPPSLVAAAIVLPWRMLQNRRRKSSLAPMLVALAVVGLWQYQIYTALKESIGQ